MAINPIGLVVLAVAAQRESAEVMTVSIIWSRPGRFSALDLVHLLVGADYGYHTGFVTATLSRAAAAIRIRTTLSPRRADCRRIDPRRAAEELRP